MKCCMHTPTASSDHGVAAADPRDEDCDYDSLLRNLALVSTPTPLFTTVTFDAEGLYDTFLSYLPRVRRQHYECRACRAFVTRYGGLVTIDADGRTSSPFWDNPYERPSPPFFDLALHHVWKRVVESRVSGVFFSPERTWGSVANASPKSPTGTWRHMHAVNRAPYSESPIRTAAQAMAEKLEEHGMLCRGLGEFPIDVVHRAHALLTSGHLYRSEKCIGVAKWLLDLHVRLTSAKSKERRENIKWLAVATAPPGYCHVRTTMIGSLLEDVAAGKPFEDIRRAFDSKMAPLQYMRPQAAPTAGQIRAAESLVEKLASAGSLARRFARLEDIRDAIWRPSRLSEVPIGGVFGHLLPKAKRATHAIETPPITVTWEKFRRVALRDGMARRVEFLVPHHGSFFAFTTADNPDAPPILQWDLEDVRNPVSWYVYVDGSPASRWGLKSGTWVDVDIITPPPPMWNALTRGMFARHGDGAYCVLRGARNLNASGLSIFPENLRSEYHGIRAAIEAYSRAGKLSGAEEASACGVCMQASTKGTWNLVFRVTDASGVFSQYRVDRWD